MRPRRAAVCNTLTRFGRLPARILPSINPERCLPQEFSDEEDIDALISAHNKTANQHLNSCLSTVPPGSQTHSGKSCMTSAQTCTCIHTPSPYPRCVNCVVSCVNAVLAKRLRTACVTHMLGKKNSGNQLHLHKLP